jgi:succinate dehydrogenase / fumarate reductase cytochrome b subunit
MLGTYYRPQLTSVLSLGHRASGVFLSLIGTPLLLWWLISVSSGPIAYETFTHYLSGLCGTLLAVGFAASLSFHFFNGIRHLAWDSGYLLDLKSVYASGWLVVALSLISTVLIVSALL